MNNRFILLLITLISFSCSKEILQQKLTVAVNPLNGGTVTPPSNSYEKGQTIQLLATPAGEYVFKEWKGDLTGTLNPTSLTINTDKTITGNFEKRQYPLNLTIEGSGTIKEEVIAIATQSQYPSGTTVRLTPQPLEGWAFISWSGDLSSNTNPLELKIDKAIALKATFLKKNINFTIRISGNGSVSFENLTTGIKQIIKSDLIINLGFNDKVKVKSIPDINSQFDGYEGVINDLTALVSERTIQLNEDSKLVSKFVLKNPGNKKIQNEFFNETLLDYRALNNIIVWWDNTWDHNYLAKDFLKWSNFVLDKSTSWGMKLPKDSEDKYINVYLHHKSGEGGPNKDIFDDGWGQGVGTDKFGLPFYTAPLGTGTVTLKETYCNCYGAVLHEFFHIAQYESSKTTFPYSGDSKWFIESSANWFQMFYGGYNNWYGDYNAIPAFTFQPQLNLWNWGFQDGKPKTWSRANHGYGSAVFLLYLSWNKVISEDFIGKAFASNSQKLPQEYLYENISNLEGKYRDFATHIIVKDNLPEYAKNGFIEIENWWSTYGAEYGPKSCDCIANDDNRFILKLNDQGSNGFFSPKETTQAWAYQTAKVENTKVANYKIEFVGDKTGTSGTNSNFYLGIVIEKNGKYTYSNIDLFDQSGTKEIQIPENSIFYIVPVSTPKTFKGTEEFNYKLKIDKIS